MGRYNLYAYHVHDVALSFSVFPLHITGASEGIGRDYALEVSVNSDKFISLASIYSIYLAC